MDDVRKTFGILIILEIAAFCTGHPIDPKDVAHSVPLSGTVLALAVLLSSVVFLAACVCCRQQRKGFKEFTDSTSSHSLNHVGVGFSNPGLTPGSELSIFPPPGATPPVSFEPLPVLVSPLQNQPSRKPPAYSVAVVRDLSDTDWFTGSQADFPRQQLHYLRECGRGWFGRVVEGEARGLQEGRHCKVIVKILREDATQTEQKFFLNEVKPYRDLNHQNVLKLVGRCLETNPYLILLEACNSGDLKSFLAGNVASSAALCQQGVCLRMMCQVASGLQHMIRHGFVHTDLAARNCLVTSDLTVKVGDYGTSIETYKDDYYITGEVAVPIRWCSPETLHCTDTTIETKQVTAAANVWSLGVLLWEVCQFGQLPYSDLTDDQVIVRVLGKEGLRLPCPTMHPLHSGHLYSLMHMCWQEEYKRPTVDNVVAMLQHLQTSVLTDSEEDFERRWEALKPNTIPITDNHMPEVTLEAMTVKSDFDSGVDLEIKATDHEVNDLTTKLSSEGVNMSPSTASPQLSVTSSSGGEFFSSTSLSAMKRQLSPSLTNLRGSLEDITKPIEDSENNDSGSKCETEEFDSWLKGVDTTNEEDIKFVKKISEAIKDLDDALALERTSSSSEGSSRHQSPQKDTDENPVVDFQLGPVKDTVIKPPLTQQIDSLQDDSFIRRDSSGTDTEEETWRKRIERGEFTEKVKEKSRSVADLMILTHIENSDGSDESDSLPSLTRQYSLEKMKRIYGKSGTVMSTIGFGSEGNIRGAVLGEEFQDALKQLHSEYKTRESESRENSLLLKDDKAISSKLDNFLVLNASENINNSKTVENDKHIVPSPNSNDEELEVESSNSDCDIKAETQFFILQESRVSSFVPEIVVTEASILDIESEPENIEPNIVITPRRQRKVKIIMSNSFDSDSSSSSDGEEEEDEHYNHIEAITFSDKNIYSEKFNNTSFVSSTPYHEQMKRNTEYADEELDQSVSDVDPTFPESTENSNLEKFIVPVKHSDVNKHYGETSVILGSCEDYTLDYFKGLKTTFGKPNENDDFNKSDVDEGDDELKDDDEDSVSNWEEFLKKSLHERSIENLIYNDINFESTNELDKLNNVLFHDINFDGVNKLHKEENTNGSGSRRSSNFDPFGEEKLQNYTHSPTDCEHNNFVNVYNINEDTTINNKDSNHDNIEIYDACHRQKFEDQDRQMNEVKSRLEDVAKLSEGFQLKGSTISVDDDDDGKLLTPDDERSSDSGFRDKGSLSESVEDACDEKYNLEDIDAELEETYNNKSSDGSKLHQENEMYSNMELALNKNCSKIQYVNDESSFEGELNSPKRNDEQIVSTVSEIKNNIDEDVVVKQMKQENVELHLDSEEVFCLPSENLEKSVDFLNNDSKHLTERLNKLDSSVSTSDIDVFFEVKSSTINNNRTGPGGGWYLHPPNSSTKTDTDSDVMSNGWLPTPVINEDNAKDNSYVSFHLDEEFVTAIRNELREKLPCAAQSAERKEVEEDCSPEDERTDIVIQYNTYPAPLSPILEERESIVSSNQSSLIINDRENDIDSSGKVSPVLYLEYDEKESDENMKFKEDICKELNDNCNSESTEGSDVVLIVEDLENKSKQKVKSNEHSSTQEEVEDLLIVDTETNQVTLVESPKPPSQLAFVKAADDDYSSGVHSELFNLQQSSYEDNLSDKNLTYSPDDSVSPISSGSSRTGVALSFSSSETGNLSGFFLSPSSVRSDLFDSGPPSLPFDLGQTFEPVEAICINKPNNEAQEILEELLSVGVLRRDGTEYTNKKEDDIETNSSNKDYGIEVICCNKEDDIEVISNREDDIDAIINRDYGIEVISSKDDDMDTTSNKDDGIEVISNKDDIDEIGNKEDDIEVIINKEEDIEVIRNRSIPESFPRKIYINDVVDFVNGIPAKLLSQNFINAERDNSYIFNYFYNSDCSINSRQQLSDEHVVENNNNNECIVVKDDSQLDVNLVNGKFNTDILNLIKTDSVKCNKKICELQLSDKCKIELNSADLKVLKNEFCDNNLDLKDCSETDSHIENKDEEGEISVEELKCNNLNENDASPREELVLLLSDTKKTNSSDVVVLTPESPFSDLIPEIDIKSYDINSTLALATPNFLSLSDESKENSQLSSFSSTPTLESAKTIIDKTATRSGHTVEVGENEFIKSHDKNKSDVTMENNVLRLSVLANNVISQFQLNKSSDSSVPSSIEKSPEEETERAKKFQGMTLALEPSVIPAKAPMPSPEDADKGLWRPTIGQLLELTNQQIDHEDMMTTSFIDADSNDGERYHMDWESDSTDEESEEHSSSSGEFIWKDGDREEAIKAVLATNSEIYVPQEATTEFNTSQVSEEEEGEGEEDGEGSSCGSTTEFVPSSWDSTATPTKSALRSAEKKQNDKKNVWFKRQKYHCVYEYPREASESEEDEDVLEDRRRRTWETPTTTTFDYSTFADWELGEGEGEGEGLDSDSEESAPADSRQAQDYDFYRLSGMDFDLAHMTSDDGEFFISSSARPFHQFLTDGYHDDGSTSQFFPGRLTAEEDFPVDFKPSAADINPVVIPSLSHPKLQIMFENPVETTETNLENSDLLESRVIAEQVVHNEKKATKPKPGDLYINSEGSTSSEETSSAETSPGLGELRHTRQRLKLDLPGPLRNVAEIVKGEASLLDSGEDSGIESSGQTVSSSADEDVKLKLKDVILTSSEA